MIWTISKGDMCSDMLKARRLLATQKTVEPAINSVEATAPKDSALAGKIEPTGKNDVRVLEVNIKILIS